jgi:hypothetical protein
MMRTTMAILMLAVSTVLLTSCNNHDSPTAPRRNGTWTITSTVSSTEGTDGCIQAPAGGGTTFPQLIIINGSSIGVTNVASCDDCPSWSGTLSGDAFTATSDRSFDSSACGHVQGTSSLTGAFSAGRLQLTATEVDTYVEASGHSVVIRYSWTGKRD